MNKKILVIGSDIDDAEFYIDHMKIIYQLESKSNVNYGTFPRGASYFGKPKPCENFFLTHMFMVNSSAERIKEAIEYGEKYFSMYAILLCDFEEAHSSEYKTELELIEAFENSLMSYFGEKA